MRRRTKWMVVLTGAAVLVPGATPAPPDGVGLSLTAAVPPTHVAATPAAARPTLSVGAQGPDVRALQERLKALGARVSVDGRFGPATRDAVISLQAARGLRADGIVGPRTWQALDGGGTPLSTGSSSSTPTLRPGSAGSAVTQAQKLLTRAGHRTNADGRFGPATSRAVTAFQRGRGLSPDGIVGPATWAALDHGAGPAPTLISSSQPEPWRTFGARPYVVRRGDTLASVAAATGSRPASLATANRLAPGSHLTVGSTLLVPGGWRCPVPGGGFINDYGFARVGHLHEGNDLFAVRGTPVVAPVRGRIERRSGPVGGNAVSLHGVDGNRYYFAHLDSYGATGSVGAGAVIGYVGNSGNAVTTPTHLHFEIHPGRDRAVNPFPTLTLACKR